jgi:hypothetical protein
MLYDNLIYDIFVLQYQFPVSVTRTERSECADNNLFYAYEI